MHAGRTCTGLKVRGNLWRKVFPSSRHPRRDSGRANMRQMPRRGAYRSTREGPSARRSQRRRAPDRRVDYRATDRCTGALAASVRPTRARSSRELGCVFPFGIVIMVRLYGGLEARQNVCAFRPIYQCWLMQLPITIIAITKKKNTTGFLLHFVLLI